MYNIIFLKFDKRSRIYSDIKDNGIKWILHTNLQYFTLLRWEQHTWIRRH